MPRDATETRDRLIRAAEHRFARDGVAGARLRDIVRDAGQANDAAVGYHFGSRQGLLVAIAQRHLAAMEAEREEPGQTVPEVVRQIIEPTAALLSTESGRDYLRIIEQAVGWAGIEYGQLNELLHHTRLAAQLTSLEDLLAPALGRPLARHRVAEFALFLAASLAQRARAVEGGRRQALSRRRYRESLIVMTTSALSAPKIP